MAYCDNPLPYGYNFWETANPADLCGKEIKAVLLTDSGAVQITFSDCSVVRIEGKWYKPGKYS